MKKLLFILSMATIIALTGCADKAEPEKTDVSDESSHSDMEHSSSGVLPENLKVADNPTYPVGSKAIIKTDHMEGMNGAEATIVGAFDTVAYSISYTPTTGGEKVEDHKWIVHEEIVDAGDEPLKVGDKVVTVADHMKGMENAEVTIDSVKPTTVYMIDYNSTTDNEEVKNHKWVVEDELEKEK